MGAGMPNDPNPDLDRWLPEIATSDLIPRAGTAPT